MKTETITIKFSYKDQMGRIPTPKKGGPMKSKRGRGSYTRKPKHQRSHYAD